MIFSGIWISLYQTIAKLSKSMSGSALEILHFFFILYNFAILAHNHHTNIIPLLPFTNIQTYKHTNTQTHKQLTMHAETLSYQEKILQLEGQLQTNAMQVSLVLSSLDELWAIILYWWYLDSCGVLH